MKNPSLSQLQQHFKDAVKQKPSQVHGLLTPADEKQTRLGIYQYAFTARLEESLMEDFAAVGDVVGRDSFAQLIQKYIQTHDSRSWTLAEFSDGFPTFLKDSVAEKYIFDLAEFEWLKIKCALGQGAEAFDPQSLIHATEAEWILAKMKVVPSLMIFSSHWPVNEPERLPQHEPKDHVFYYALFRSFEGLQVLELTDVEVDILEEMNMGKNFGQLAENFGEKGIGVEQVGSTVGAWVQAGLIEKVIFGSLKGS